MIVASCPSVAVIGAFTVWGLIFGAIIGEFVNRSRRGK